MRKAIVINGKSYPTAEMDIENVCTMEDLDAPLTLASTKPISAMRAYLAICMKSTLELAGKEFEAHIIGGGSVSDLADALKEAIEESDFFQGLIKNQEEKTQTVQTKEKQSKK